MARSFDHTGTPIARRPVIVMAAAAVAWVGRRHAQAADATQPINELYTALHATMRLGTGVPFQRRFDQLAPVIDKVFDVDTILRTSVGLKWNSLDEATRKVLFSVFRSFTIASYAANFDKDSGEKFDVLPQTRASGADLVVQSKLISTSGDPIRLDYVMRTGPSGWRVVDVLLDGSISRVAVQRSDFRALMASGDPAPLINSLKQKVTELSGGTMRS